MERALQLVERLEMTSARLAASEARADEAVAWVVGLLEAPKVEDSWWKRITGK